MANEKVIFEDIVGDILECPDGKEEARKKAEFLRSKGDIIKDLIPLMPPHIANLLEKLSPPPKPMIDTHPVFCAILFILSHMTHEMSAVPPELASKISNILETQFLKLAELSRRL